MRRSFLILFALFIVATVSLGAFALLQLRADAIKYGIEMSSMHTRAFEDFLTEAIHATTIIAGNATSANSKDLTETNLAAIEARMTDALRHAPMIRSISMLGPDGDIVASTLPANRGVIVDVTGFMPIANADVGLVRIGEPWEGRDFNDGRRTSPTRPASADRPGFIPIVLPETDDGARTRILVALNPDRFINHVTQKLDPGEGTVNVLRYDGILLMDSSMDAMPGVMRSRELVEFELDKTETGTLTRTDDKNQTLLTAYRASRLYPLVVITNIDRDFALRQWRAEASLLLGILVPGLLITTVIVVLHHRRQRSREAERLAYERLQRVNAASVFNHAREGIVITDADCKIIEVNDAFVRLTGYQQNEVSGKNPNVLSSGHQSKAFYNELWDSLLKNGFWSGEIWNRRKDGELFATMQTISAIRDEYGKTVQYVGLFSDITKAMTHQAELERTAHFDSLTELPNRLLLYDRLKQAIAQSDRRNIRLAVVFIDLDGFKAINDNHGHEAGDLLLIQVAARMRSALREGDTLARPGGDEFVAVLLDLPGIEVAVPMLTRLLLAASEPVLTQDLVLQVSASIGVTFYPQTEEVDADQLLRQADQAMYQAKISGKNRFHLFDADQDRSIRSHHEEIERIRKALALEEFELFYQPKVNMRSGAVVGAEALIRWRHPENGLLLPGQFLPLIEDHPLAIQVGEWVINQALVQMHRWKAEGLCIPVSVNVGARQLMQPDFVSRLNGMLAKHPLAMPMYLEIELLETCALNDIVRSSEVINACRALGVRFSIDDFGTGYSSLTYLKRLPVDRLKIDRSFVNDMINDAEDIAILQSVLDLSLAFRRQVIAEGVETVAHGELLLRLGCELAQGFGIARPMVADHMVGWINSWQPDRAWQVVRQSRREDVPLLLADIEHRAWISNIEAYLQGDETQHRPAVDDQPQCSFSNWLNNEGLKRYGTHPSFDTIVALHEYLHRQAESLCELHDQNRKHEARARVSGLHGLHNTLLDQLHQLAEEEG